MQPARSLPGAGVPYPARRLWALIASIVLMVGGIVLFAVAVAMDSDYYQSDASNRAGDSHPPHLLLAELSLLVMLPAGTVLTAVLGWKAYRHRRRARGKYTARERREVERTESRRAELQRSWDAARELLQHLAAGHSLQQMRLWGPVLRPGEQAFLQMPVYYARYYGVNPVYVHTTGFFVGSAPFVLAGSAFTALGNHHRRQAALASSLPRWREFTTATTLVTNERIMCEVNGRWLSFFPRQAAAIYPDPTDWSVVLDFGGVEPVCFFGLSGPTMAVATVWIAYGRSGLADHPSLEPLRRHLRAPVE